MNDACTYRFMEEREVAPVSDLVARVFMEYIAHHYSPEGIREFFRYINPATLTDRCWSNHFALVAIADDKIIGTILIRNNSHISLFFVDKPFQGHRVGRDLLDRAISVSRSRNPELTGLTVNSSPNSVDIYTKYGFQETAPEKVLNGIRFTPMTLLLPTDKQS